MTDDTDRPIGGVGDLRDIKIPRSIGVRTLIVPLLVLAVVAAVVWLWRPLFHAAIYRAAYSPGLLIVFGLTGGVAVLLLFTPRVGDSALESMSRKTSVLTSVFVIALVIAALYGIPAGMVEERALAEETMENSLEVEDFPAVNEENPRIAPRAVADVQTRGSVSYRQHQLGASDIARMDDGRLAWSYPIQPDPFRMQLSGHQRGVFLSDMTAMEDRELRAYDEHEFAAGQNMIFHRSADWNLKKTAYWSQYRDEPVEFVHDGEAYMAYPKTGHEWRLSPIPHTVPVWDGVGLVAQDGSIEHLSPEEAQQSEVLDGQRLYPIYNAQREASSLGYRNGIVNQMSVIGAFEGVIEPARLPSGAGNTQPFVIDLAGEEMAYVLAMEPYGDHTRGLDEVWFFKADAGETVHYATGGETLIGPERAMGIVRSEDSRTDWKAGGEDGQFQVVEPVPTVIDEELWWHSKVVPTDNTDVTRNVFVNAHGGEAVELYDTEGVIEFISGEDLEEIDDAEEVGTDPADEQDDVAYYIVIYDDDGEEIDRIPVESGQEVNIEQEEDEE